MNFSDNISTIVKERTCFVGMGNYYKSDDGVGLYIVDRMKDQIKSDNIMVMNVEDVIESYIFKIAELDCKNVIIVDAVKADSAPGSVVFGKLNDFDNILSDFSTHKLCLNLASKVLEQYEKDIYLLGIVVDNTDFGVGVASDIIKSADLVKDLIIKTINCGQKEYVYEQ